MSLGSDSQYLFTLSVSKANGAAVNAEVVESAVLITVTAGAVPTVGIVPPPVPKLNPSTKLMLRGQAAMVMADVLADAPSSSSAATVAATATDAPTASTMPLLASSFVYSWRLYEVSSADGNSASSAANRSRTNSSHGGGAGVTGDTALAAGAEEAAPFGFDLSSPNVSSTGSTSKNLVVLPFVLTAGATYMVELHATYGASSGVATT